MGVRVILTVDRLREVQDYDPETGEFIWIVSPHRSKIRPGDIAGPNSIDIDGYRIIQIDGKQYKAHRLAWLFVYGEWPTKFIDHINGNPADNRIANLREATYHENARNRKVSNRNLSGFKGVCTEPSGKFRGRIRVNGVNIDLGLFDTPQEANFAYVIAAQEHFGEYARAA